MLETLLPGAQHLQNPHPLVVHFPIAFLIGAVLFYWMAVVFQKEEDFSRIAFSLLVAGVLSLLVAAGTGLWAEPGVMVSRSVREHLLVPHKQLMIASLAVTLALTVWATIGRPFPKRKRPLFLFSLLFLVALMTWGADYGGRMVYDYNAGGSACSQPIEFSK